MFSDITIHEIKKAEELLSGIIKETPLDRSRTFSEMTSSEVYLKLENLQKTGSFKTRGAYIKLLSLGKQEKENGVIAASAGNHAQGVAYSSSLLKIKAKVIMPENASPAKIDATKGYGAEVILHGKEFNDSLDYAISVSKEEKLTFIHAYDDKKIITGQGTVGLEVIKQLPDVDAVIVPVGGGGLISGISIALKSYRKDIKVYGVQSEAFPSAYTYLKRGRLEGVESGDTIADGIAVKKLGEITSKIISNHVDDIFLVSDREIAETLFLMLERAKIVSEPAGAASLTALLSGKINLKGKKVVCIISGGNIDMYMLDQIVSRALERYGRLVRLRFMLDDKPGSLKSVIDTISSLRANILDIIHERLGSEVPLGKAAVTISLETQNNRHTEEIIEKLRELKANFKVVY